MLWLLKWRMDARRTETISGKAQTRLLAWVVSDARGAQARMDKALAETVGKRLQRQAQKVLDDTALAAATAQQACAAAELAAAADTSLRPALPALLAEIKDEKQRVLRKPQEEVYVGFHELESLLAHPQPPEPPKPPKPPVHSVLAAALQAAQPEEPVEPDIPPIPPELARALGSDGVQALWQCHQDWPSGDLAESSDWWQTVPFLVAHTLIDHSWMYQQGKEDGAAQVREAVPEDADEDEYDRLLQAKEHHIILLESKVALLERQLKLQARGETLPKAVRWGGVAVSGRESSREAASKRARHD